MADYAERNIPNLESTFDGEPYHVGSILRDLSDTSFLVTSEIAEHAKHEADRRFASERSTEGCVIAAQVLTEFCYVVTDARRLERPLSMPDAPRMSTRWRCGREVTVLSDVLRPLEIPCSNPRAQGRRSNSTPDLFEHKVAHFFSILFRYRAFVPTRPGIGL